MWRVAGPAPQWGQGGSVVTMDRVLGCPVSLLQHVAMLVHAACEGLRAVTMVSSSGPKAAVARGAISVWAVGHASRAVWGSTEHGQGTQMARGLERASDTAWLGDTG